MPNRESFQLVDDCRPGPPTVHIWNAINPIKTASVLNFSIAHLARFSTIIRFLSLKVVGGCSRRKGDIAYLGKSRVLVDGSRQRPGSNTIWGI